MRLAALRTGGGGGKEGELPIPCWTVSEPGPRGVELLLTFLELCLELSDLVFYYTWLVDIEAKTETTFPCC